MPIKFKINGQSVFARAREQREQQQRSRDRCKLLGVSGPNDPRLGDVWKVIDGEHGPKIKEKGGWEPGHEPRVAPPDTSGESQPVPIASKSPTQQGGGTRGRYLTASETHDVLRQLFVSLEREFLSQVMGANGRQSFGVDEDRACQFAHRCLSGRALAFWKND